MFCLQTLLKNPSVYKQGASLLKLSIKPALTLSCYSVHYFSTTQQDLYNTGLQASRYCKFDESIPHFQQVISSINSAQLSREDASLLVQAYHRLGEAHKKKERYQESLKEYLQGLEIAKRNDLENSKEAGLLYHGIAEISIEESQWNEARACIEKAKEIFENSNDQEIQSHLLENGHIMGLLYEKRNETQKAIDLWESLLRSEKKGNKEFNPGQIYVSLGRSYYKEGNEKKAKECWEKGIEVTKEQFGEEAVELLPVYLRLTDILFEYEQLQEARVYAEKAVKIAEKHLKEDDADLARYNFTKGILYFETHDFAKASETFQKALKIYLNHAAERKEEVAYLYLKIAETYALLKDEKNATEIHKTGLDFTLENLGPEHPKLADYYLFWSDLIRYHKDRLAESKESLNKALAIYLKSPETDPVTIIDIYFDLGVMLYLEGNYEEGLKNFKESMAWATREGPYRLKVAEDTHNFMGLIYLQLKQFDESIENFTQAMEKCVQSEQNKHLDVYYRNLGLAHENKGDTTKAVECFQKALELAAKNFGKKEQVTREYVDALVMRLTQLERVEEAEKLKKEYPAPENKH